MHSDGETCHHYISVYSNKGLLPHVSDTLDLVNAKDDEHSDASSKDAVGNKQGGKLIYFSGEALYKYWMEDTAQTLEAKWHSLKYLWKSVIDYALVTERRLEKLFHF